MGGTRWVLRPKLTFATHHPRVHVVHDDPSTSHPTQMLGPDGCGPSRICRPRHERRKRNMQPRNLPKQGGHDGCGPSVVLHVGYDDRAILATLTLNRKMKVCVVHHDASLSSGNALDAHEPRISNDDRYPTLRCMPCASEISSYEPPHVPRRV